MLDNTKWSYMKLDKKVFEEKNCIMFLFGVNWDNSWQYLTILCDTWKYLTILSNTKKYLPILNYTNQYLTIPVKPGISWYCLVLRKHQVSMPIWFQYHEGIIVIWFWWFFVHVVSSQYWFWQFSPNIRWLVTRLPLRDSTRVGSSLDWKY
jgi:hypothetical protein